MPGPGPGSAMHSMVQSQLPAFQGEWGPKVQVWGQIERPFKCALLGAVAPSLYNPALMQMQKPNDIEVDAAVAFIFGKVSGSPVEINQKNNYAQMMIKHIKSQTVSPVFKKTRVDVFTIGMDIIVKHEVELISTMSTMQEMWAAMPQLGGGQGLMAGFPGLLGNTAGQGSQALQAGVAHGQPNVVQGTALVAAHPGRRSLLIQGSLSRELLPAEEGGADDWTVEDGYVCSPTTGLLISVADCLADVSKPWPETDILGAVGKAHEQRKRLQETLDQATMKAKRARMEMEAEEKILDEALATAAAEVAALEAEAQAAASQEASG